jgi:hypothetical protein
VHCAGKPVPNRQTEREILAVVCGIAAMVDHMHRGADENLTDERRECNPHSECWRW